MADFLPAFDLNVRLEEDDDGDAGFALDNPKDDDGDVAFDLNDPPLEHDNGITCSSLVHFATVLSLPLNRFSYQRTIVTGFDLNLPLDEFGAVDFDYLQNLAGT